MAMAAAVFAAPAPVMADVMQVGASGAEWIAGGPAPTGALPDAAQGNEAGLTGAAVQDVPLAVDAALHPQSMTVAQDAAGPARWRARVAQLAAKYDISPALLEAVVWQESRWNERAISPAGARGLAQLMPGTAAQMGVNPGDPMANLEGGARYLRMQLDAFGGDVEKALAAYNAGPLRVEKAGGVPNIRETKAYVAAIMGRLTDTVRP
ncbi:lytic transglycosylase domain-containing protein [Novosphingobium sp. 2638]|uniref:Lytic transglycosylase domain-containing protein n=2 Tax=Novosphingobium beihaiensis TaxID=2930389 RepID=A0ABT0BVU2_9SPHN|nr:lytic transglycosylase domain-containing protein [Novosphingobium beihaiensis]MCJ2189186.1 lytic transglycosylase domain-containing protein [Novosphingobium beihaiensis]